MSEEARYHFVLDRLAVGDVSSRGIPGWGAVISCLTPEELTDAPPVPAGVPVLHISVEDGAPGLRPYLDTVVAFIREHIPRGVVLVHCGAGQSRSVSVVVAYLVWCGMSLQEARALVRYRRGNSICPYPGFIEEIRSHFDCETLLLAGPRRLDQTIST